MPKFPLHSAAYGDVRTSLFSSLAGRLKARTGPVFPLHIGDTWLEPAVGCRMQDLTESAHPGLHRYAPVQGIPPLVEAIVRRVRARFGAPIEPKQVLVSAGATGGLNVAMGALLSPGDEVLILAPHWPLFSGIVRSALGAPVSVPFIGSVSDEASAVQAVEEKRTSRTVAIYINTPNNPTGQLIPASWLRALVAWARAHDLWILSDEVYEDYVYEGEHTYLGAIAPERTLSFFSFSKAFGLAGARVGYVVGPASVMPVLTKVSTHTYYSVTTASQYAALHALGSGGLRWLQQAKQAYQAQGLWAAQRLGVAPPKAGTFLFIDLSSSLGSGGMRCFLEDRVDQGLLVAPGEHFGPYPQSLRLCFTSAPPKVVREGVEILARAMGR